MASSSVLQTTNHLRQSNDLLLNCLFNNNNINEYFQIPIKSFTMSVRHIHMQAQALAELERERVARRVNYARRKERTLNGTQAQMLAELERERVARRASYARRKERTLNDPEYRKQVLQSRKISRDKKRQAIEDDPLHV